MITRLRINIFLPLIFRMDSWFMQLNLSLISCFFWEGQGIARHMKPFDLYSTHGNTLYCWIHYIVSRCLWDMALLFSFYIGFDSGVQEYSLEKLKLPFVMDCWSCFTSSVIFIWLGEGKVEIDIYLTVVVISPPSFLKE